MMLMIFSCNTTMVAKIYKIWMELWKVCSSIEWCNTDTYAMPYVMVIL
jgi:hypothetical protein